MCLYTIISQSIFTCKSLKRLTATLNKKSQYNEHSLIQNILKGDTIETSHSYSLSEEIWHSTIHGIGLLLSVSALSILCVYAGESGDGAKIASAVAFGLSLMVMYGASTLYHAIIAPKTKSILQQIDHCAIYILIAGTYTPISLLGITGVLGGNFLA